MQFVLDWLMYALVNQFLALSHKKYRYLPVPGLYWADAASIGPVLVRYWQLMLWLTIWFSTTMLCDYSRCYSAEIRCDDPGVPTNGRRTGESFTYHSVVLFSCDPGITSREPSSSSVKKPAPGQTEPPHVRVIQVICIPNAPLSVKSWTPVNSSDAIHVNMPLFASTGPVLVRCWQHRPSTVPVLVR